MRNANKFAKSPIPQWSEKWKVTRNPYPGPDHHGKLNTSRWPPLAHAYHVWWTSVATAIVRPLPLTE